MALRPSEAPHSPVFGSTATIENVAVIGPADAGEGRAGSGEGGADGLAEIVTRISSNQPSRVVVWCMMGSRAGLVRGWEDGSRGEVVVAGVGGSLT